MPARYTPTDEPAVHIVDYEYRDEDWTAYVRYLGRAAMRRPRALKMIVAAWVGLFAVFVIGGDVLGVPRSVVICFVGVGFVYASAHPVAVARAARPVPGRMMLQPTRFELTPSELRLTSPTHSLAMPWRRDVVVGETRTHLFVEDDDNYSHVVPKRAFASQADIDAFVGFIRERCAAAEIR